MQAGSEPESGSGRARGRRAPSMADVAAVVGVSHQTVSRVINNKGSVREETRQRVLNAMAEMSYRRNESARALASAQSRLLGVVMPRFVEWGPATTLLGIQLAANRAGYYVNVATPVDLSTESVRSVLDGLLGLGIAGLVVISPVQAMARELDRQSFGVPTIVIASMWPRDDSEHTRIWIDQRSGVKAALEHLSSVGCESVAHIAGPTDEFDAIERERAWKLYKKDLEMALGERVDGDWSAQSGYEAMRELLKQPLADAVFVANDQMALGALKALSEAGKKVPGDIRLFGFDDEDGVEFYDPSLTTVRQDFAKIGELAIQSLTALIRGEEPATRPIPTELRLLTSA